MKPFFLLLLLPTAALAQLVNVQQAAGTYSDESVVRRDGTGNRVQNSTGPKISDTNVFSNTNLYLYTNNTASRTWQGPTSFGTLTFGAQLEGVSSAAASPEIALLSIGSNPDAAYAAYLAGGAFGALTATPINSTMDYAVYAYDGASWINGATIRFKNTTVPAAGGVAASITFRNIVTGSTVIADRASIDDVGRFNVGLSALSAAAWGTTGLFLDGGAIVVTDSSTAASGTATNAVFNSFSRPTLAATNALVTTTNAATTYIANAPAVGANQTITNAYALWVDNGTTRLDGLVENTGGTTVTTASFDKTDATAAAITGLSSTLENGKNYGFEAVLYYDATALGGQKYAMNGTATGSAVVYQITSISNASNLNVITSRQTALAGEAGQAGSTAGVTRISGTITTSAAGTITPMFAQNAANGTSSVLAGSYFRVWQF